MLSVDVAGERTEGAEIVVVEAPSYSVLEYRSDFEDKDRSYIYISLAG